MGPQSINIKCHGHAKDHGYVIPCDVDSQIRIKKLIGNLKIGDMKFSAWPVERVSETALLWFKIPMVFVKQVDPVSLFRTVLYKNGWTAGYGTYQSCHALEEGTAHCAIKFLATRDLVRHIMLGQDSQIRVNITTAQRLILNTNRYFNVHTATKNHSYVIS